MNLRNVDLNLLTIFDAIMVERNMTRAAERVGMTQPAISNALSRLRALTGDPLFTRTAKGMTPTPRAETLATPVRQALDLVRAGLTDTASFHPDTSTRNFVVAMGDYCEVVFLPKIVSALSHEAPHIQITALAPAGTTLSKELKDGTVDLVWDTLPIDKTGFVSESVFDDRLVCIMATDNPLAGEHELTPQRYETAAHIRLDPGHTYVHAFDRYVRQLGIHRQFAIEVSRIIPMGYIAAESQYVATVPYHLAMRFAKTLPIAIKELPLKIPQSPVYQSWSETFRDDPGHKWFRTRLKDIVRPLEATS
ncbi:MAG: LysR substrate-binding domain-containing protein [Parvibaculum sp.]